MIQASGASTQPSIISSERFSSPTRSPAQPINPLKSATSAIKASSMAPTFSASVNPSPAPRAAASIAFTSGEGTSTLSVPIVSGSPSSGYMTLEIRIVAGAAITLAAIRWPAMFGK